MNEREGNMVKLFNVNPFAEAMLYYLGKANNDNISKKLDRIISRNPPQKETVIQAGECALKLEKFLDEKLVPDNNLINKYFKKFECEDATIMRIPFDFCLASVMVLYPLMANPEYTTDELCEYLRSCSMNERLFNFSCGLLNEQESLFPNVCDERVFSEKLENLPLPIADKWKIQSALLNYHVHIEELISIMEPAIGLVKSMYAEFKPTVEKFNSVYSVGDEQQVLSIYSSIQVKNIANINISPLILGFDRVFNMIRGSEEEPQEALQNTICCKKNTSDEPAPLTINVFLGTVRHIVRQPVRDVTLAVSEGMKALSDKTRLDILFYLNNHKAYGQELCAKFGLVRSALSYHMSKLEDAGFVSADLSGSKTYYIINKENIMRIMNSFIEKIS